MPVRTKGAAEFRSRRRPQLSDEVSSYVRDLIMSGEVRQGEFLRLEHIADELGVSVTPVREAMLSLRGEGFVNLEARRGFTVAPLSRQDVEDLFRVQADVAAELTARASERSSAEVVEKLADLQERLEKAAKRKAADEVEELNFAFHRTINLTADSAKLAWILGTVVRYAPRRFFATIHGWQDASVGEHHTIIEALRESDAEKARATMHQHITHAGELLVTHLAGRGMWDDDPAK
ncbi:MAG TPA: GntR family transcriptional regulator [Streptosporangiaceae bacterium]|jgi:DNA-binding GntR family transcriptional regulator